MTPITKKPEIIPSAQSHVQPTQVQPTQSLPKQPILIDNTDFNTKWFGGQINPTLWLILQS